MNDDISWHGAFMAYTLPLTAALKSARWKVKIRDKETREPPHVTIIRGTQSWRINLRSGAFMEEVPDPQEVPEALSDLIKESGNWKTLCDKWNEMYPTNRVSEADDEE